MNRLHKPAFQTLPEKLIDILLEQRNGKAPHPFLIVENVPTDHAEIGSETELEFHIENAAPKHLSGVDPSPTGLMFTCVHEDENGPATRVGDARPALRRLTRRRRDNRFALHARDKFTPSFDDEGRPARWIQRVFVSQSLWSYRNLVPVSDRVYEVS